jgi:transcriptional regulator with XRE-family HTH domain
MGSDRDSELPKTSRLATAQGPVDRQAIRDLHTRAMDDVRLGRLLRAVRRRGRLRQVDVAIAAGVSQQTVSRLERGRLDHVSIPTARSIARALEVTLDLSARWRGAAGERLLDGAHARLVEIVIAVLREAGFEVIAEYSFNHFGERGSVDVVGWHPVRRALVIVEVKSDLVDTQDLNASMNRKARIVPRLLAEERGWQAVSLGRLVVLPDRTGIRHAVDRHRATFSVTFPGRTRAVTAWLREPVGSLAAIWFVRDTRAARATGRGTSQVRIAAPTQARGRRDHAA